jgi:DNA-directed RNA polymerase specialized sigma24 family protein
MEADSSKREGGGDTAPDGFASTEWSMVLEASSGGGPALDRLCRTYWRPVYVYIRASGVPRDEAEDATQEFFADMLRRNWLKLADRERGSFRGFLRSSTRFFISNWRRRASAQKRGGGEVVLSLDTEDCEREFAGLPVDSLDPALLYDRSWADCVIGAAVDQLATEQRGAGKADMFERLRGYLTEPPTPGDYDRIATEFAVSAGQVALWVHRLSRRFAEIIRIEVTRTVANPRDVEEELRHLLQLFARKV